MSVSSHDHRRMKVHLMAAVLALVCLISPINSAFAAPALEIIQPRSGLTINNRYYRAYPGLPYEVQIAAIGGNWPYAYRLVTGPAGASIDAKSGVLKWSSPPPAVTPYSVSVSVTDSSGTSVTVSWTVTVTTTGFSFIDSVNGRSRAEGGDGSIGKPWHSILDWYTLDKWDASLRGQFLYFRQGSYDFTGVPLEDGVRLALIGTTKPLVWLAYPGEQPTINTEVAHIGAYGDNSNFYVDGFRFYNMAKKWAIRVDSGATDVVLRNNLFEYIPAGLPLYTNVSAIMIANGPSVGRYWSIIDNEFRNFQSECTGILGYATNRALVERNTFSLADLSVAAHAIGPKSNNQMWFIRNNRIRMGSGTGIWVDTYAGTSDVYVEFNLVRMTSGISAWFGEEPTPYGPISSRRNTFVGGSVRVDNLIAGSGPVSFTDDVVVNSDASAITVRYNDGTTPSVNNLLSGKPSDSIVTDIGDLSPGYAQLVGKNGYQTEALGKTPLPPAVVIH